MVKNLEEFEEILQDYIELFEELTPKEQLQTILELGQDLEEFPSELKTKENKVKGCISDAFIACKLNEKDGSIIYLGTSDALIIKGYIALLIEAISGLNKTDIEKIDNKLEEFATKTNIKANLSQSRSSAFGNIIGLIKQKANTLEN